MANFKTHFSFGMLLGLVFVSFVSVYLALQNIELLFLIFVSVLIGSFLPDLDSDGGKPFQIVFGMFSIFCSLVAFLFARSKDPTNVWYLVFVTMAVFVFVRLIIAPLVKKFTHHRGMFHSIPAIVIAMLGSFYFFDLFTFNNQEKEILSLSVGLGYLGHLILDELKSATGFHGVLLKPSQSLGSALKFFSRNHKVNLAVYLILVFLVFDNWNKITYVLRWLNID